MQQSPVGSEIASPFSQLLSTQMLDDITTNAIRLAVASPVQKTADRRRPEVGARDLLSQALLELSSPFWHSPAILTCYSRGYIILCCLSVKHLQESEDPQKQADETLHPTSQWPGHETQVSDLF